MTLTAAIKPNIDDWGILYIDGSTLRLATYTPTGGLRSASGAAVGYDKVIFTMYGSVVGFTHTGTGDDWDATDIKFDPRTTKTTTWAGIPYWSGTQTAEGYITTTVHTAANVKTGLGDICKLAGKTAAQANGGDINGGWRLPTNYENGLFAGDLDEYEWTPGTPASGIPGIGTFGTDYSLPALGVRNYASGSSGGWGTFSSYWSSTGNDLGGGGYSLEFHNVSGSSGIRPSDYNWHNHGFPIRCVKQ